MSAARRPGLPGPFSALYVLTLSSQTLAFASRPAVARSLGGSGRMRPLARDPRPHVGHVQRTHPIDLTPLIHPAQAAVTERPTQATTTERQTDTPETTQATKTGRPQALWSVRSGPLWIEALGAISGGAGGAAESLSLRTESMTAGGYAAGGGPAWGMGRGSRSRGDAPRKGRRRG
jgi:hypothetical protein